MLNLFKTFFLGLVLLSIVSGKTTAGEMNHASGELASEFYSLENGVEHSTFSAHSDNFFRRLFGLRKKSEAQRRSRSQRHSGARPQRYSPPPSDSQTPESQGSRNTRVSTSSDMSSVQNAPKNPLHISRRDQYHGLGLWELGFSLGTAHSITDIGASKGLSPGDFASYHTSNFGFNAGFFTRLQMNEWFAFNLGMNFMSISAETPANVEEPFMNAYRFTNNVFEFHGKTELILPTLAYSPFDVYAFIGIGVFFSDAQVFDIDDRRQETNLDYSQVQPVIPMGVGAWYRFPNNLKIGYEFGWRNTIFYHLDGIKVNGASYDHYFLNSLSISFVF